MTAEQTATSRTRTDGPAGCRDLENLDLEDLLGRVARGDHGAFGRLCTAVSDPVYGVALSVLADAAEAEEITRQVLVAVWRTAPRYQSGQGTATAWLMTLAHRHAVNRARATRPARTHTAAARHRHGLGGLGDLTGLHRQTVTLAYHDGHTYPQIAARLATTTAVITTSLHQALIRLNDHPNPRQRSNPFLPEPEHLADG